MVDQHATGWECAISAAYSGMLGMSPVLRSGSRGLGSLGGPGGSSGASPARMGTQSHVHGCAWAPRALGTLPMHPVTCTLALLVAGAHSVQCGATPLRTSTDQQDAQHAGGGGQAGVCMMYDKYTSAIITQPASVA